MFMQFVYIGEESRQVYLHLILLFFTADAV